MCAVRCLAAHALPAPAHPHRPAAQLDLDLPALAVAGPIFKQLRDQF